MRVNLNAGTKNLKMSKNIEWQNQRSRYLFQSQWFSIRQDDVVLPNGQQIPFTLIEHPGYAMIIPLLEDGNVVMERVYRYPVKQTLLECPSGSLEGEPPEKAACRELEEETAYRAGKLELLGSYFGSSGSSDEHYYIFLATDLRPDGTLRREITEQIELELVPLTALRAKVVNGDISDGPTALAILLASEAVENQRKTR